MKEDWQLEEQIGEKRFEKQLRRQRRKEKRRERRRNYEPADKTSRVLNMLYNAHKVQEHVRKGELNISIPSVFSLIENPSLALRTIYTFSTAIRQHRLKKVFVDHSSMSEFDLAAEAVLDLVANELKRETKSRRKKPRFSGRVPKDKNTDRFIRGIGIISSLHVEHEMLTSEESRKLRIFRARNQSLDISRNPKKGNQKGIVAARFVDHINDCLDDHGRRLTPEARLILSEYCGEIIGNAEDHADLIDWSILGYLDNQTSPHMCEIAIFNFGKTIADTFLTLSPGSYAFQQVSPYLTAHGSRGFFGPTWTKHDLLTLVALQGHISSKNTSDTVNRPEFPGELRV